jgi:benzoyl-CoA reductase/2-hydroxyglutaryl-CoA dehydratase subunit BcrC/BadD/HgdB
MSGEVIGEMMQGRAKDIVKALQAEYYAGAMQAKKEGKPVAWVTSVAPREFLEAMDIVTIYPENHAAAIGAKKVSMEQMAVAESLGYSMDICSYARVNLGYVEAEKPAPIEVPYPDFVVCCNNICNTVTKWYEALAHRLNIPIIMFDLPFSHDDEPSEHALDFIVGEFKEAIKQLEQICGRKFDHDRFQEVMNISNQTSALWQECQQMGKAIPSPIDGLDMFNYMALAVCMRGSEKAMEFFALLRDELAEKKSRGESAIGGEKYRILWDGIAIWFNLRNLATCLRSYQACMVASTYPDIWVLEYDDLRSMAHAYTSVFLNRNLNYRVNNMARMVKEFSIDGVIIHSPRSCKPMDFVHYALSGELRKITGVPVIVVDGDQTDPRNFSEAQFQTRVQALFEMIEGRKSKATIT